MDNALTRLLNHGLYQSDSTVLGAVATTDSEYASAKAEYDKLVRDNAAMLGALRGFIEGCSHAPVLARKMLGSHIDAANKAIDQAEGEI